MFIPDECIFSRDGNFRFTKYNFCGRAISHLILITFFLIISIITVKVSLFLYSKKIWGQNNNEAKPMFIFSYIRTKKDFSINFFSLSVLFNTFAFVFYARKVKRKKRKKIQQSFVSSYPIRIKMCLFRSLKFSIYFHWFFSENVKENLFDSFFSSLEMFSQIITENWLKSLNF